MIIYRGTALENVAPVKISDIVVSPIQQTAVARDRALQAGAQFVRLKEGTRTVTVTFALLTEDRDLRARQIHSVNAWARASTPAPLYLPYREGYLMAICTGFPEVSTRQWWESRLRLTFTAFDPYFITPEKSSAMGQNFTVLGDAPPLMRFEYTRDAEATEQAYVCDGVTMYFSTIPAGKMVIDLNQQTAAVDGTSIMSAFAFGNQFITPRIGVMNVAGAGTVYWRERWI